MPVAGGRRPEKKREIESRLRAPARPLAAGKLRSVAFAPTTGSMFDFGFQGGLYDATSGLYNFRHRDYSTSLGRWMEQDPAGYVDGLNLYQFVRSNPAILTDPQGLAPSPQWHALIPEDPSVTSDLGLATAYRDEAYNRSAYHWDRGGRPGPRRPWGTFEEPENPEYTANQYWYRLYLKWDKRVKELQEPAYEVAMWLKKRPYARYGPYTQPGGMLLKQGARPT